MLAETRSLVKILICVAAIAATQGEPINPISVVHAQIDVVQHQTTAQRGKVGDVADRDGVETDVGNVNVLGLSVFDDAKAGRCRNESAHKNEVRGHGSKK